MRQLKNFSGFKVTDKQREDALKKLGGANEELINKYGSMNEEQLISEVIKSAARSKKDGTYDPEQMLSFVNGMSPYLSDEQKEKLENVISIINSQDDK